jgi:hypothetical protein
MKLCFAEFNKQGVLKSLTVSVACFRQLTFGINVECFYNVYRVIPGGKAAGAWR